MRSADVAVVIPVYNGVGIVDRCISAVLRQTKIPEGIICVDDSSKDGSYEHIKRCFPDITVVRNEFNMGASGTYARGIKEAISRGYELIWLLDQDSLPLRNALEELLLSPFAGRAVLIPILVCPLLGHVYDMLDHSCGIFPWRRSDPNRPHEVLLSNFSGMLLPRQLINSVGTPSPVFRSELADWEFSIRIRRRGWSIIRVPRSIVYHAGGRPILGPRLYRRRYLRFHKDSSTRPVRFASSKLVVVSSYPPERYFERGRNVALLLRSSCVDRCIKIFILKWVLGIPLKILLSESEKKRKITAYLNGLSLLINPFQESRPRN